MGSLKRIHLLLQLIRDNYPSLHGYIQRLYSIYRPFPLIHKRPAYNENIKQTPALIKPPPQEGRLLKYYIFKKGNKKKTNDLKNSIESDPCKWKAIIDNINYFCINTLLGMWAWNIY